MPLANKTTTTTLETPIEQEAYESSLLMGEEWYIDTTLRAASNSRYTPGRGGGGLVVADSPI